MRFCTQQHWLHFFIFGLLGRDPVTCSESISRRTACARKHSKARCRCRPPRSACRAAHVSRFRQRSSRHRVYTSCVGAFFWFNNLHACIVSFSCHLSEYHRAHHASRLVLLYYRAVRSFGDPHTRFRTARGCRQTKRAFKVAPPPLLSARARDVSICSRSDAVRYTPPVWCRLFFFFGCMNTYAEFLRILHGKISSHLCTVVMI